MKNRRGQIFGIYLVVLTLVMVGVVIGLYLVGQANAENSLVSPKAVLEIRDELEVFEMREMELISSSLIEANKSGNFGDMIFDVAFRSAFISGVDEEMKDFLLEDLMIDGKSVSEEEKLFFDGFLEKRVYPSVEMNVGSGMFKRMTVGKKKMLFAAEKDNKIHFPVEFSFEFERKYLISLDGDKFKVVKK